MFVHGCNVTCMCMYMYLSVRLRVHVFVFVCRRVCTSMCFEYLTMRLCYGAHATIFGSLCVSVLVLVHVRADICVCALMQARAVCRPRGMHVYIVWCRICVLV